MEEFGPVLFIGLIWLLIGIPLSKAARNAKNRNNAASRPAAKSAAAPDSAKNPAPAPAPAENPEPRNTRLTPTVSITEHNDSIYQGSMNAVTGEGYDPCHEEDLHGLNAAEQQAVPVIAETHSLPFGWTGSDMVRGVVISEILKRKSR